MKKTAKKLMTLALALLLAGASLPAAAHTAAENLITVTGGILSGGIQAEGSRAYCYNEHLVYPSAGDQYRPQPLPEIGEEYTAQIRRALYAGYPINGKGFYYLSEAGTTSGQEPVSMTANQAYYATQEVIWAILAPLESSMTGASPFLTHEEYIRIAVSRLEYSPLAKQIYEFAMSGEPLPGDEEAQKFDITGDARFEKGEDGKWYTGQLTVNGAGSYQLFLPAGIAVDASEDNTVAGNEPFYLVSESRPAAGEVSVTNLTAQYVPEDIRFYTPVKEGLQNLITFQIGEIRGIGTLRYTVGDEPVEPQPTDPQPTEPQPTEPQPTEPQPTEPQPTEPQPTEPQPTEPQPTEPQPTEPQPTDPQPTEPQPTEPQPTGPQPTEPQPTEPQPTDHQPTEPVYPPYVPPVIPPVQPSPLPEISPEPSGEVEIEEEETPLAPAPGEDMTIDEQEIPLAPAPQATESEELIIVEEDTPLGNLPQTGSHSDVFGVLRTISSVLILTSVGLMALAAYLYFRRREQD